MLNASRMSSIHGRNGMIMHINTPNTKTTRPSSGHRDSGWAGAALMQAISLPVQWQMAG